MKLKHYWLLFFCLAALAAPGPQADAGELSPGAARVAYAPDEGFLTVARSGSTQLYRAGDLATARRIETPGVVPSALAFSPDGGALALGSRTGGITVWSVESGERLQGWSSPRPVSAVAFSRDGSYLAWAVGDATVQVWKTDGSNEPRVFVVGGSLLALTFRRDGKSLAVAGEFEGRGGVRVVDLERGSFTSVFETAVAVDSIAYSVDGQLAAASAGTTLYVWERSAKKKYSFQHTSPVRSLAFGMTNAKKKGFAFRRALFPDSQTQWLAWGTEDGAVCIWQLGEDAPTTLRTARLAAVTSLAFDSSGKTLAVGSERGFGVWGDGAEAEGAQTGGDSRRASPWLRVDKNVEFEKAATSLPREEAALFEPLLSPDACLVVEVERVISPPSIDGKLDDWSDARRVAFAPGAPHLTTAPAYRLRDDGATESAGTSGNSRDLSGDFSIRWSDDGIYLAAWVHDNVHDVEGTDSEKWWHKDSVSLYLDVPRDGDGGAWISGDHAFTFVADAAMPDDVIWWRHGDGRTHRELAAPSTVRMAVEVTGDGYTLEAAIPMAVLEGLTPNWRPPYEERVVGFMVIVADPDGGPDPFGGELIYGGDNDDDGEWAGLRLVSRGTATAPRFEVAVPGDSLRRTTDPRIVDILTALKLPDGFGVNLFATVPSGPSRLAVGPAGRVFVTAGGWGPGGKVWMLTDSDGDGAAERREVIVEGLDTPLGLTFRGSDLYVTHRTDKLGRVSLYRSSDRDGDVEFVKDVLTTGPGQGHGISNVQLGPDDRLYVAQGSKGDVTVGDSRFDCTIWRMDPDGSNVETIATGMRSAYGFAFDAQGRLFATEQGPNHREEAHPDEFNYIVEGQDYGFPAVFVAPEEARGTVAAAATFAEHASACGLGFYHGSEFPSEYHGNAFAALWGPADPTHVDLVANPRPLWDSYYIARIEMSGARVERVSRFAGDFRHPIDVLAGPDGALYVADWGSTGVNGSQTGADGDGAIFRISVVDAESPAND